MTLWLYFNPLLSPQAENRNTSYILNWVSNLSALEELIVRNEEIPSFILVDVTGLLWLISMRLANVELQVVADAYYGGQGLRHYHPQI